MGILLPPPRALPRHLRQADDTGADMDTQDPLPWFPSSGVVINNAEEGNCLYHSLAKLVSAAASIRSHRQVRAYTCEVLKKDASRKEQWEEQGRANAQGKLDILAWERFIAQQETNGVWGGALEATAYAKAQHVRLWIASTEDELHFLNKEGSQGFMILRFDHRREHYEAVTNAQRG